MNEDLGVEQPIVSRPRADMRRAVLLAAVAFAVMTFALYAVFGTFWDKKGIFWGGVHNQHEYRQALADYQGHRMDPVRQVHLVTVSAEGTATAHWEVWYSLRAGGRARVHPTASDKGEHFTFRDARGRPIPMRRIGGRQSDRYLLLLPPDLHKGDLVHTRGSSQLPAFMVKQDGEDWLYDFRHVYGPPIPYHHEVTLPAGAKVLGAQPAPQVTRQSGNRLTLVYDRSLGNNEFFKCRVRYRLAEAAP
jgi:hypothetical protein